MKQIYSKILLSKSKPKQWWLTILGGMLGLAILMAGIHLFFDAKSLLVQKIRIGEDFFVVNKKIGLGNMLFSQKPATFSQQEIADFSKIKGIEAIGKFRQSKFKIMMSLSDDMKEMLNTDFKTLLFFESVPNQFLDIELDNWKWKEGEVVPIILSSEYIKLYNLAFAGTQDLPVVSENILKRIKLSLDIRGNGNSETVEAKLLGFSDRINSVLVPETFIDYGNKKFSSSAESEPTRLIVKASDITSSKIKDFVEDNEYQINEEKFKTGKINSILKLSFIIVGTISLFVIVLALMGFIQYIQLMAYRSADEIETLSLLGVAQKEICKPYLTLNLQSIFIMFGGAILLLIVEMFLSHFMFFAIGSLIQIPHILLAFVAGIAAALGMYFFSNWQTKKQIASMIR